MNKLFIVGNWASRPGIKVALVALRKRLPKRILSKVVLARPPSDPLEASEIRLKYNYLGDALREK